MSTKIVSKTSALSIALVLTSSWVGQAQAFMLTNGTGGANGSTYVVRNFGTGVVGTCADLSVASAGTGVYGSGSSYDAFSGCNVSDTRFKASTAITSQAVLRTATGQVVDLISDRVNHVRMAKSKPMPAKKGAYKKADSGEHFDGLAAGNEEGFDGWVNTAWSHARNKQSSVDFVGDLVTAMAGLDYPLTEGVRAGVGLGVESSGMNTHTNQGQVSGRGMTFVPYMAFDRDGWLMADLQLGYSKLDYSMHRRDPATTHLTYMIEGDMNAHRWFGAFNLKAMHEYRNFIFGGKLGALWAEEHQNSFRDTSGYLVASRQVDLGRANLGLDIDYDTSFMLRPFIGANAVWDFDQYHVRSNEQSSTVGVLGTAGAFTTYTAAGQEAVKNGEFAVIYSAGFRFHHNKMFDAALKFSSEQHRKHYHNDSLMLDLHSSF